MSRRGRAVGFASAAAVCAGIAAGAAGGPAAPPETEFGELREIVVAAVTLPARRRLREADLEQALELRRVPESFVPPGALTVPAQAVGRAPAVPIPAGSPLLATQFERHPEDGARARRPALDPGRRPIEIAVDAAGALAAPGADSAAVDVVVTTEPGPGGGAGRTYVAAQAVELLELRAVEGAPPLDDVTATGAEAWIATLALTRSQALRLIQAESFARSVRLIGR